MADDVIRIKGTPEIISTFKIVKDGEDPNFVEKEYKRQKLVRRSDVESHYKVEDLKSKMENLEDFEAKICRSFFRILIVDDEIQNRDLLFRKLISRKEGYKHVDVAEDGTVAWEMVKQKEYDIILSDYRMPDMDGYKLWKKIKELPKQPIFIMITGFDGKELSNLEKASVPVLKKPFSMEKVCQLVKATYSKKMFEMAKALEK